VDDLIRRARDGDEKAEKELFQYLLVRFRAFASRRVGDDEADDVAQNACLAVLKKYRTETFTKGFQPWAYGVLKMEVRSYIRTRSDRASRLDYRSDTEQMVRTPSVEGGYDLKVRLSNCLRKIVQRSRSYARVLNLIHQGFKSDEVCKRLSITPNNFYVILSRGRQMMKVCLKKGTV
jgi:RNA polymerase sigma factor (sigma-70 family)